MNYVVNGNIYQNLMEIGVIDTFKLVILFPVNVCIFYNGVINTQERPHIQPEGGKYPPPLGFYLL